MLPKPPQGYLDRSEAQRRLNVFIHGGRFDGPEPLPRRADPAQVDEFVKKAFDADKPTAREVAQCGLLMRFFDLRKRVEQVPKWLNRQEREDKEVVRSLTSVAILGDMGDDVQQKQAGDYYQHLAGRTSAEARFEHMVDIFFHLPEQADPKWITDPIDKKMKSLEPKVDKDLDAKVEYLRLKDIRDDRLARIVKAKNRRHEIVKIVDPRRRRQELIRCYLRLEVFAYADLREWSVMMLQRDCNAASPPDLAAAFSQMLELLMQPASVQGPTGQKLHPEDEKACVTSCARAVEFYGGKLSEKQAEFVAKKTDPEQNDSLYWEPEAQRPMGE